MVGDLEKKQVTTPTDAVADVEADNYKTAKNKPEELKKVITPNEEYEAGLPLAQIASVTISGKSVFGPHPVEENTKDGKEILDEMKTNADKGKAVNKDERDAQKAAIEAAKRIVKLDDDMALADALDMNVTDLEKLAPVALANRVVKSIFTDVFKAGYLAKCDAINESMEPVKVHTATVSKQKVANAMRHIRILKAINSGLGIALFKDDQALGLETVKKMVSALPDGSEVNEETVKKVFNAGDLRDNPVATAIVSAFENK